MAGGNKRAFDVEARRDGSSLGQSKGLLVKLMLSGGGRERGEDLFNVTVVRRSEKISGEIYGRNRPAGERNAKGTKQRLKTCLNSQAILKR